MDKNSPKYVALTFDDGPSPYTFYILDILKRNHILATFFVVGSEAKKFPNIINRIHSEGHVIGNHTWSHPDISTLSESQLRSEIHSTNDQIKKLIGISPNLFRAPYGAIDNDTEAIIKKWGMTSVLWNVDSQDWCEDSPFAVQLHVIAGLQKNSLIVMHDGDLYGCGPRDHTVASLNKLIQYLQKNDYQFITVPEFHKIAFKI
ncbi:polysaccharide deacetylase family protein [Bacillus salipaludis]|uniref:Polysaccharide deacetylase family protein n=1 Tax=Bacillus salipaludis TaxID=2547811 RepID=A0A4V3AUL4_9BACI|nr:polysaccharide deacetylase family protein [Bacillus salipaludis]MDQ6596394.1 polysaccharide deacetylase family protein [Bacillus salipaludis]TDK65125.1 polysaccharide deacetylase family protein [Bacillus salipaludis]